MSGLAYLGIAYLITWVVIAAYLFSIMKRQKTLERRLEEDEKTDSGRL